MENGCVYKHFNAPCPSELSNERFRWTLVPRQPHLQCLALLWVLMAQPSMVGQVQWAGFGVQQDAVRHRILLQPSSPECRVVHL